MSRFFPHCFVAIFLVHGACAQSARAQDAKRNLPALYANRDAEKFQARLAKKEKVEIAIDLGLKWFAGRQSDNGRWFMEHPEKDPGKKDDVTGTALGLLPFLAVGMTHKPVAGNPYDKVVDKGLYFLRKSQNQKTGYFGGSMISHGLATIALCEAYGMTKDPMLRVPAQKAVDLIVKTQHEAGGWRFDPIKTPGDLSVTERQLMALKAAQTAGLEVPAPTTQRAIKFLDAHTLPNLGYRYNDGPTKFSTSMTAVGLLCRQQIQMWGLSHPKMGGALKHLSVVSPESADCYHHYYATQVMYNIHGKNWPKYQAQVVKGILSRQDTTETSPLYGSISAKASEPSKLDPLAFNGGRLFSTSLQLLTLELDYRYTPLFKNQAK
jgi:hypothetical protein